MAKALNTSKSETIHTIDSQLTIDNTMENINMAILAKFKDAVETLFKALDQSIEPQKVLDVLFNTTFKSGNKSKPTGLGSALVKATSELESDALRKARRMALAQHGSVWLRKMKKANPNNKRYEGVRFSQKATGGEFYIALIPAGDGGGSNVTDDSESFVDCDTITSIEKLIKRDTYEKVAAAMVTIVTAHNKAERK